jgi:hypothetical protein
LQFNIRQVEHDTPAAQGYAHMPADVFQRAVGAAAQLPAHAVCVLVIVVELDQHSGRRALHDATDGADRIRQVALHERRRENGCGCFVRHSHLL